MSIFHLILREIAHRRLNFGLGILAVGATVFVALGSWGMLAGHDRESEQSLSQFDQETAENLKNLEDAIRKSMKGLGLNIFVYPEGQERSEVYAQGYASKTMPEDYVSKLANSDIVTVNHLLPSLTRKIKWPEQERTIVLIGVRGEVPLAFKDPKKPLIDPVASGELVMGYELHKGLGLEVGSRTVLMGKEFVIGKCHPERGTVDDITVWMNLKECQELLELPGKINAILALECNCETLDRLAEVRAEISAILPGTQIIEKGSRALARAEARVKAKQTSAQQRQLKESHFTKERLAREKVFTVLVPSLVGLCLVVVGILSFVNVRDRQAEIGIFRAIGVSSVKVLGVFLGRAWLLGFAGVVLGMVALVATGAKFPGDARLLDLLGRGELLKILLGVPILACGAAWLPSLAASRKDPAEVLRHD